MIFSLFAYRSWKRFLIILSAFLFLLGFCYLNLQVAIIDKASVSSETIQNAVTEEFLRRIVFVSIIVVILNLGFYFVNNIVQKLISIGHSRLKIYFNLLSYVIGTTLGFLLMYLIILFLLNHSQRVSFSELHISSFFALAFYIFYLCTLGTLLTVFMWSRMKALFFFIIYLAFEYVYEYVVLIKFEKNGLDILPLSSARRLFFNSTVFSQGFSFSSFILPILYLASAYISLFFVLKKRSFPSI